MTLKNKKSALVFLCIATIFTVLAILFIRENRKDTIMNHFMIENNLFPIDDVMKQCGYQRDNKDHYTKIVCDKEIMITFDFESNTCYKNQYTFDISNSWYLIDGTYYMQKEAFEKVINHTLSYHLTKLCVERNTMSPHEWAKSDLLIAHAGGIWREKNTTTTYTNSYEALVQNYNLGHRIFEFDFYLTSDQKLAAVHDWIQFGYMNGVPLSAEEWKSFVPEEKYTTLMVEDILDEMLVNEDFYLITDTKSTEITEEETILQFQIIYDEAMKRDASLLDRIIPQIYNERMYTLITQVYDFPNIIYTAYSTPSTGEEIIEFSSKHDNICAIVCPFGDSRFIPERIITLHEKNLKIYAHTINNLDDVITGYQIGYDGFYTDSLLPQDLEIYTKISQ